MVSKVYFHLNEQYWVRPHLSARSLTSTLDSCGVSSKPHAECFGDLGHASGASYITEREEQKIRVFGFKDCGHGQHLRVAFFEANRQTLCQRA